MAISIFKKSYKCMSYTTLPSTSKIFTLSRTVGYINQFPTDVRTVKDEGYQSKIKHRDFY